MRFIISLTLIFCLFQKRLDAQNEIAVFDILDGYWEGAFIKNNSSQKFELKFYKNENQLMSFQIMEEWHPQFGEFDIPVEIDSLNNISFNTGYGKAMMYLDKGALELNGAIDNTLPTMYVHLKKVPKPPKDNFTTTETTINNNGISLTGHLHEPILRSETAMIVVGGRGCYAGSTKYDLYAKLLRSYGITVVVYNKRGTGKSSGDCNKATISDLASDVVAWKKFLEKHPNKFSQIGILGSSAGGWVMTKAQEQGADFDFMIGVVAPATSVKDQQFQSMKYGLDFYKLSDKAKVNLNEYTNLLLEAKPTDKNYNRFKELLSVSIEEGWAELLDDTDIPKSKEDINNLWVRRHSYDPEKELKEFNKPLLEIYGEIDWIVPYKENIEVLDRLFKDKNEDLLTTVVAHDAEHGTETAAQYVNLENNRSYWRFYRIAPSVQVSIIDFLFENNFVN